MSQKAPPPPWKSSAAKSKLTEMINDPSSNVHTLSFDEIYALKYFKCYERRNFKRNFERLYTRLTGHAHSNPVRTAQKVKETKQKESKAPSGNAKKEKKEPWKSSLAKAFLYKLLTDPSQPLKGMTPKQVYDSHPVFKPYAFERFTDNMKKLAEIIEREKSLAELEMEEFEQDMKYYNKKVTCRGYPFWHKHEAKKLLASDVKSGTKLNCLLSKVCSEQ